MNRFRESRGLKIGLLVIVIVLGSFGFFRSCFASTDRGAVYPAAQSKSVAFSSGDSLEIKTVSNDVILRTDPHATGLTAQVSGSGKTDRFLEVSRSGSSVEISFSPRWRFFSFPSGQNTGTPLVVTLPEGIIIDDLSLTTVSGDIAMETDLSVRDEAEIRTTSGDVSFTRLDASSAELKSVSGDITGDILSAGKLEAKTVSGDISLQENEVDDFDVSTTSGRISLLSVSPRFAAMELKSISGSITVVFTGEPSMKTELTSTSGALRLQDSRGAKGLSMTHGTGDAHLEAGTTSGGISVSW